MVPIMDMNDDTYAHTHSLKQVSEYERIFEVLAAGQSSIPADSMGRLMRKMGIHCSRDELRELRDLVDQDGYGQVHMEDFVRLMTKKVYEDFQEEDMQVIDNAFKMYDKDEYNNLSISDIRSIVMKIAGEEMCDDLVEEILAHMDASSSQGITYDKLLRLLSTY